MRKIKPKYSLKLLSAVIIVMLMAGMAHAVTYDLTADEVTINMPDGTPVMMWGFGLTGGAVTVPGPVLEAVEGDALTINLTNNLAEPVTVVIHGQRISSPSPVMSGGRVMSFTPESASVTFTDLKAGTYLYESGTHPAKQVQMGLYGVLVVRPTTAGRAYDDPVSQYDDEHVLVFSDIDPLLHTAVQNGDYGTTGYPSTADYLPRYFLVNGKAYPDTVPLMLSSGQRVLLRMVNAGLRNYVPMLQGQYMTAIAEDGNLLPFPQSVLAVPLPAGKSKDVIAVFEDAGRYSLFDRRLNLSNAGTAGVGGLFVPVVAGTPAPVINSFIATPSTIIAGESSTLEWATTDAGSVSINQGIGAQPVNGSIIVSPAATTTYTLTATGPGGTSTATATVTVIPVPVIDSFTATPDTIGAGESSTLEWATTDADTVSIDQGVGAQPVNGSVVVSPAVTTTYTLTASGPGGSVTATATVTVVPVPVIDSFTATPDTIGAGESSTLEWATTDADTVSIDQGVGPQAVDGSVVVSPAVTTIYTLTATGPGGTVTATATVTVLAGPVTATFTSIAAHDGWVRESSFQANIGGATNSTATGAGALRIGDEFISALLVEPQLKSIVSFDTSSLPDTAVIQSATLRLVRGGIAGTNPFTTHGPCYVDIASGSFNGSTALQSSDFQAAATAARVASMSNPTTNGSQSTGSLNAAGLAAINKVGFTQLRVYFALDDNDDGGTDAIGFYSGDNGTPANRPVLEITYIP